MGKCVCFQGRTATESRPYSYALFPHEKAEKQPTKAGRPQALDRFVHNRHAFGGPDRPLLHTLFPYTTLFRSESEERRVGKECKIGRAHV